MLFLAPYAGLIADRVDKRRLLVATQTAMGVLALAARGADGDACSVKLWMVYVLAFGLGIGNAVDNPTRQAFVLEMVGPDSPAQRRHPELGARQRRARGRSRRRGHLIATVGVGVCFLVNAGHVRRRPRRARPLDRSALRPSPPAPRARGQLREGFSVRPPHARALSSRSVMMAVIGMLAYEFQVVLPVVARSTYRGGAQAYGFLTAAMGARRGHRWPRRRGSRSFTGTRALVWSAAIFGGVILLAAAAPNLAARLTIAMALVGAGSVGFLAIGNATLQLNASPMHARTGHGALGGRVPRLDPDRRSRSPATSASISAAAPGSSSAGSRCLVAAAGGWLCCAVQPPGRMEASRRR